MGWYSEVSRNVEKIPEAIQYFENELKKTPDSPRRER